MPVASRYLIPAQDSEITTVIKRSRFIAHIAHCPDPQQAMEIIERDKLRFPDARHHCWAYIACPPNSASAVRFSDAGEPSGTAGKPILNVLQHSHYGEIICVVSRYFGGIKLGAGGLVRAYSSCTQAAVEQLTVKEIVLQVPVQIRFPYCYESSIRHFLELNNIQTTMVEYQEQVVFKLGIEKTEMDDIVQQLQNICRGEVALSVDKSSAQRCSFIG